MLIRPDDLSGPEIRALLREHLRQMHSQSPPSSVHALDGRGLQQPNITVWTAWRGPTLLGCGALKALDDLHGEVKSMHTVWAQRRTGVGRAMLAHLIAEAQRRGYRRLSLETGSQPAFEPARQLYARQGFVPCAPFGDYRPDPHSVFMSLAL